MKPALERVFILGTGLLGSSTGLALRSAGFTGSIIGWDKDRTQSEIALRLSAVDQVAAEPLESAKASQLIVLATPVFAILDWMEQLAAVLGAGHLVTDVGSTKVAISNAAARLYNRPGRASFLAGHPMAGKEVGGAAEAEAQLFQNAAWIFMEMPNAGPERDLEERSPSGAKLILEWIEWVRAFGCRVMFLEPARHDELLAWVSHLPQFLSTALTALIETEVGDAPELKAIGGRALREMTRLGSSPYSMWRDVAMTNTDNVAEALQALEQRLAHLRENLRTPELRDEFELANRFRRG